VKEKRKQLNQKCKSEVQWVTSLFDLAFHRANMLDRSFTLQIGLVKVMSKSEVAHDAQCIITRLTTCCNRSSSKRKQIMAWIHWMSLRSELVMSWIERLKRASNFVYYYYYYYQVSVNRFIIIIIYDSESRTKSRSSVTQSLVQWWSPFLHGSTRHQLTLPDHQIQK